MSSSILQFLEITFGRIPDVVYENSKYLTYDDDREEFTCMLCDKVMQKNATKNLEAHINSGAHREKTCTIDKVTDALKSCFLGKIPQIVMNNICILDIVDEGYECVICNKILKVSKDPKISVDNFSYHLTSSGHENSLGCHDDKMQQLSQVYGWIPEIVFNNKDFLLLNRGGTNYTCTLCDEELRVYINNIERTRVTFEGHFNSQKHLWGIKQSKVLAIIPELNHSTVHTYLIRNIDYISNNGNDLYCSLCQENIKRSTFDINETEENLKHHILSSNHEGNMFGRQNEEKCYLENLRNVFGVFTDEVLKNIRFLELNGDSLRCSICDEEIYIESDCDESNSEIIVHLESDLHKSNVSEEESRCINLINTLEEDVFGGIPPSIIENLDYIEFLQGSRFQCTLCQTTLQVRNIERHLSSYKHEDAVEYKESLSESLNQELEDLFGLDCEDNLPECIYNNWEHIEYDIDSGNFCCNLCDETILVDEGSKKEEISLQNFKIHLLSAEHTIKLKLKAKRAMKTFEELELFHGGVPKSILSNIHVLEEQDEDSFYCNVCNVEIRLGKSTRTSTQNFLQHLRGSLHKSNIEDIETSIDNAYEFLDENFGIPECLLRDIDFWDNSAAYPDVYCTLCQEGLSVDPDNLTETRRNLEYHVESGHHRSNLEAL